MRKHVRQKPGDRSLRRDERARAKCGPPPPEAAARAAGAAVESNYQPRPEAGRPYSPPSEGLLCRRSLPSTFAGYGPRTETELFKQQRLLTGRWLRPENTAIFNFQLSIFNSPRLAFTLDFSYLWLRPRYSRSAKRKRACFCPRLFVHLTASNALSLGKTQASLLLPSLIRTFAPKRNLRQQWNTQPV